MKKRAVGRVIRKSPRPQAFSVEIEYLLLFENGPEQVVIFTDTSEGELPDVGDEISVLFFDEEFPLVIESTIINKSSVSDKRKAKPSLGKSFQKPMFYWPSACIGCGTKEDLSKEEQDMEQTFFKYVPTLFGALPIPDRTVTIKSTLYICNSCKECAIKEQKMLKQSKMYATFLGILLSFLFPMIDAIQNSQIVAGVLVSFFIMMGGPIILYSSSYIYTDRKPHHSYYDLKKKRRHLALILKSKSFFEEFISLNSNTDLRIIQSSDLRICSLPVSKRKPEQFWSQTGGIWCFGFSFLMLFIFSLSILRTLDFFFSFLPILIVPTIVAFSFDYIYSTVFVLIPNMKFE